MLIYRDFTQLPDQRLLFDDPNAFLNQSVRASLRPLEALGHEVMARPDFYELVENYRAGMMRTIAPLKMGIDLQRAWPKAITKNDHLPMDPWSAGIEVAHDIFRDYPKPEWNIRRGETQVEPELLTSTPFCELVKFSCGEPNAPTILAFAPMSGHHATLIDDKVKTMVNLGFNVVVTDWVDPKLIPLEEGEFDLDSYIQHAIDFIGHLLQTEGSDLHLEAICQPGPAVIAALAVRAQRGLQNPASLVLTGSPIDTSLNPTPINESLEGVPTGYFRRHLYHTVPSKYPGAGRKVIPGFLQNFAFKGPNLRRHVQDYQDYYLALIAGDQAAIEKHRQFRREYEAMTDLSRAYMHQTKATVFLERHLANGCMKYTDPQTGEVVAINPGAITNVALKTVEGAKDDITGLGQCQAAHGLLTGVEVQHKSNNIYPRGHYGIFSGSLFQHEIAPNIAAFMRQNKPQPLAA